MSLQEVSEPLVPLGLAFDRVALEVLGVDEVVRVHGRDAVGLVVAQVALDHASGQLELLGGVELLAGGGMRGGGGAGDADEGDESEDGMT